MLVYYNLLQNILSLLFYTLHELRIHSFYSLIFIYPLYSTGASELMKVVTRGDIISLLLRGKYTTPSRIYRALSLVQKKSIVKYNVRKGYVEGLVVGDSGLVHVVKISNDGYKCSCSDFYSTGYMCKHIMALIIHLLNNGGSSKNTVVNLLSNLLSNSVVYKLSLH